MQTTYNLYIIYLKFHYLVTYSHFLAYYCIDNYKQNCPCKKLMFFRILICDHPPHLILDKIKVKGGSYHAGSYPKLYLT